MQVPTHIRLHNSPERFWQVPSVSRREILRRDQYQCQYCGSKKHLTIDHIIPRCKGGKHSWENVVIACSACNSRKGDKTPEQVGMKLKSQPKAPIHPTVAFAEQFWQKKALGK
jgi:5-methylcytosine-specific restriction endonuclease McrA